MVDYVLIILLVLLMTRAFIKNRENLKEYKKLSKTQLIGVIVTFIFTVGTSTALIVYGKKLIEGKFPSPFLEAFIFLVILFFVFIIIGTISDKAMKNITKGVLPKE
ncbi:hypothetical protein QWT69_14075 [Sporosarcina oncorhynchi]|uniref:Uncharacterized protein n=1 Tax=Sporosarcina oncorhynchi TaxID=3056444 RepID=A0ABZ0L465_9BACL|nr:hypothetical protein [Sporosarcina sp. T2O-4]WOV86987.1 hypothetical protein QWT69_14075 [Sporosarcina sp. T2O-4]